MTVPAADTSAQRRPWSHRARLAAFIAFAIVLFIATHWPQLRVQGPVPRTDLWIHLAAFALWGALLTLSRLGGPASSKSMLAPRIGIAVAYAILDESLQAIPALGRVFALDDLAANILGATLGVLAAFAAARAAGRVTRHRSDRTSPAQPSHHDPPNNPSMPRFPAINDILVATTNPHKLDEFRAALQPRGFRVLGLNDLAIEHPIPEPDEHADSFDENAAIKAIAYASATGRIALADDSGLVVDALGGAPGVRSARYAGHGHDRATRDAANNAKLLRELAGVPAQRRTARFVCAVCVAGPDGSILATSHGNFEGIITEAPRGTNGFGYDPLLELPDGRTAAELTPAEKDALSHRGHAARAIAGHLARLRPTQADQR